MLAFFTWEITSDLFFGTVSSVFSPNMFKKQDGMLAFFFVLCLRFSCPKLQKTKRNARLFRPKKSCSTYLLHYVVGFLSKYVKKAGRNARLFYLKNVSFGVKHGHSFILFGVRGYPRRPSFKKVCKPLPKTSKF